MVGVRPEKAGGVAMIALYLDDEVLSFILLVRNNEASVCEHHFKPLCVCPLLYFRKKLKVIFEPLVNKFRKK